MASGAAKNKMLDQKAFSRKHDLQEVATGDRRRVEIGPRQCDVRRSCSSNQRNLT